MKIASRVIAPAAAGLVGLLALSGSLVPSDASVGVAGRVAAGRGSGVGVAGRVAAGRGSGVGVAGRAAARPGAGVSRPVVLLGLAGLRWTDLSPRATPAIWRLASAGSVGSLITVTVNPVTCPVDGWLTLSAGARAVAGESGAGHCPALPQVRIAGRGAEIPALAGLIQMNTTRYGYLTQWRSVLAGASPGCATAIGPGAALALASPSGRVSGYLGGAGEGAIFRINKAVIGRCPLTVIDLGALPASGPGRRLGLTAADRTVAAVEAAAPAGTTLVLAGLADDGAPRLRALIVSGPGYRAGLLTSASTRQPGVITITDLTPSVYRWLRGRSVPASYGLPGAVIGSAARGPLPAAVAALVARDTAEQVYRAGAGWFFLACGLAVALLLALAWCAAAWRGPARRGLIAAACYLAAIPASGFLAMLFGWPARSHPALWCYGLTAGLAIPIAAAAMAGPWRRTPFGPPGAIGVVTLAVIAGDALTGSGLQAAAPFGIPLLAGDRYYGIGNNVVGGYACAGLIAAAWAAAAARRRAGSRRAAVIAAGLVAAGVVLVAGYPGAGAKVGGTIAMMPAFGVLLAAIAGVSLTPRRGMLIAVSGVAAAAILAGASYLGPGLVGASHQGSFFGQLVHGSPAALATLRRKALSNLGTLTRYWYGPLLPVVLAFAGASLAKPARLGARRLAEVGRACPLALSTLRAAWLAVTLIWLADDAGVRAAAAGLLVAVPLAVGLGIGVADQNARADPDNLGGEATMDGAGGAVRSGRWRRRGSSFGEPAVAADSGPLAATARPAPDHRP